MSNLHRALNRRRWESARLAVLRAAKYRCAVCGRPAFQVHHKIPLSKGGAPYDVENLEVRCRPCHFDAHPSPKPPGYDEWRVFVDDLARRSDSDNSGSRRSP